MASLNHEGDISSETVYNKASGAFAHAVASPRTGNVIQKLRLVPPALICSKDHQARLLRSDQSGDLSFSGNK